MNIKQKKKMKLDANNNANIVRYISLDPSFQGVNTVFLMAYSGEANEPT